MSPFTKSSPYTSVSPISPPSSGKTSHDEEAETETDAFLNHPLSEPSSPHPRKSQRPWGWISSTFLLALLSLTLLLKTSICIPPPKSPSGNYATGFSTDLESAKRVSSLIPYRFTGGLSLTANKTLVRDIEPGQPQYAGQASKEVDKAWDELMRGLEIVLTGGEAESIVGKTMEEPEGGKWRLSLDVYHSLHCVNEVRKGLDKAYYHPPSHPAPYFYRIHIDHCIDYLRQVVQCQSDLTPLYYYWDEGTKGVIPRFGNVHTCRNFEAVDEWALQRISPRFG